ncbi:MAG: hypothetical protein AAFN93_16115, partial [Bacteroidota bacterium]
MGNLSTEIQRDGTSQIARLAEALLPDYVQVDERSTEDYLELLHNLSEQFVFKNEQNISSGNWHEFFGDFAQKDQIATLLDQWESNRSTPPHLTVVIAFLKLLELALGDLNKLTKKHLDFFYTTVLGLQRKGVQADSVHVVFEIAKNANKVKLDIGTQLDAGKDANKNIRKYELERELILNRSAIASLRSVFVDKSENYKIFSAPVANSLDGQGKEFIEENAAWKAFGQPQKNNTESEITMLNADVGFAFSSPLLLLSEGERFINLDIAGRMSVQRVRNLHNDFKIYITGEKGWIPCEWVSGLLSATGTTEAIDEVIAYYHHNLSLKVKLSEAAGAAVPYNEDVHKEGYKTQWPMIKVVLNHETKYAYEAIRSLEIDALNLQVDVRGLKTVNAENEQGVVDVTKPFFPLGTVPRPGSKFSITSPELSAKKIDELTLAIDWDNLPGESLGEYYGTYDNSVTNSSFKVKPYVFKQGIWQTTGVSAERLFDANFALDTREIAINSGFETDQLQLIQSETDKNNGILLELNPHALAITALKAFGHQEYTNLYTDIAMRKAKATSETDPEFTQEYPKQPYTPQIKNLAISYVANDTISLEELKNTGQFFKIEAFGHAEVKEPEGYFNLLPSYEDEGNFYIGLSGLEPPSDVSLLFQVAEGSGEVSVESEVETIKWSYLTANGWQALSSGQVLTESTLNLQKSGIIAMSIGREAIKGSTQFIDAPELFWLRGSVSAESRQICKVIQLYTNATKVKYVIEEEGLQDIALLQPETITKLINKKAEVKKVIQPYASFDGRSEESDPSYYTRVCERIRHKNRQTTIYDYERSILQRFPEIYKVKCLQHADAFSDVAPGNVTLLVISNLRNQNAANPLEPTTSYGTLVEVGMYVENFVS